MSGYACNPDESAGIAEQGAQSPVPGDVRGGDVSAEDVENRRYVYCSVTFHDPLEWAKVIVPKMRCRDASDEAKRRAESYVGRVAAKVDVYGANYVRDARAVQQAGGIMVRRTIGGALAA